MGKPAALSEIQKQEKLVKKLQEKKADLREETRENNKKLDTEITTLQCMISGEEMPDMFSGKDKDDE